MQNTHNSLSKYPFLILLLFLLCAYLPVFLPFFHLKNDLITQNLPTRFFISESLYSDNFPWWNPYLNYGTPQYGDMNNGYWNPFLWVVAKFIGYNILTITLEEMLYILIGGWGIFKLVKDQGIPAHFSVLCSLAYMSGGYIIGHLQHFCWITGTAFFPYVLLHFLRCVNQPILRNFLAGGLFSFLFLASTHPGLIIGAIYFFLFLIAHLAYTAFINGDFKKLALVIKSSSLYALLAILFSLVVVVSNFEVLQHITRGAKVSVKETLSHPTTLQSYLSLLFPMAVHKGNFFFTDISMRNMSIGITLLPGIYFYIKKSNLRKKWILIVLFVFFVLLGAGGYFKLFAYHLLPYLGYVRLNGEFAYFTYLMLLLASIYGLHKISFDRPGQLSKSYKIIQNFFIVSSLVSLAAIFITQQSVFLNDAIESPFVLKSAIDRISFWDLCFINSLLHLSCAFFLRKYQPDKTPFLIVSAINLILISWACLPFTGLGQKPRKEIQAILNTVPRGINIPSQNSIENNLYLPTQLDSIIGSSSFYSKQIGFPTKAPYPVILESADSYFRNDSIVQFINKQAFLFLSDDTTVRSETTYEGNVIKIVSFTPTKTKAIVSNDKFSYLIFLQNNYPRWQVLVDEKPVKHFTAFKTFIGIKIPEGAHKVEFRFETGSLQSVLWINISVIFIGLIVISQKNISSKSLFR